MNYKVGDSVKVTLTATITMVDPADRDLPYRVEFDGCSDMMGDLLTTWVTEEEIS